MIAEFLPGNDIALLENGAQFFPALESAIAAAACEVQIETYIFADDATGQRIVGALGAAARRGIAVRVLVDGFGASKFATGLGRKLVEAGVQFETYRPKISPLGLQRQRLRRLHRKLAVIDGSIAFVGGINIIDDVNNDHGPEMGPRCDYAVLVTGPLVARIHASMQQLWRLVGWARLQHRPPVIPPTACARELPAGAIAAAFVVRDNLRNRRAIEDAYLEAIAAARSEVLIASAYFLPGLRFRHALRAAAGRGVAITVLLQGQVEYPLLHYATQALYRQLLADGVRIHEYRAGFLHAKVAVIDGHWATVGSSNIDPFSLLLAREANVVVRDAGFASRLRASLQQAMTVSAGEIGLAHLQGMSLPARALRWIAYGVVQLMLGITRYGGNYYRE